MISIPVMVLMRKMSEIFLIELGIKGVLAALKRVGQRVRRFAEQINTAIIIVRAGELTREYQVSSQRTK